MADSERPLRLGTRASRLARWQADFVAGELRGRGHAVEVIELSTRGDVEQSGPIASLVAPRGSAPDGSSTAGAGQGVFTKELQRALLADEVDLAVHSLKDLPTAGVPGLTLGATPPRAPVADVLISPHATTIDDLPPSARIGTGSLRRRTQLLHRRPDLRIGDLRGNVETRLRKLDDGEHDAILLAEAGLTRLGYANRLAGRLDPAEVLPAPAQGALGVECRADDVATLEALDPLNDPPTRQAVTAERVALRRLEGGCLAALGAWARRDADGPLRLSVVVLSEDGQQRLFAEEAVRASGVGDAIALGTRVADDLLARGAAALLRPR